MTNRLNNISKDKNSKNNKQKIILLIAIILCVVLVIVLVVSQNKFVDNNTIETTTIEQTNNKTANAGESYTFVGSDGQTYRVTDNGTYLETDEGVYKIEDYHNISLFRTYSYCYNNGTKVTITLSEDGTYEMVSVYPTGYKSVAKGEYEVENGFESAMNSMRISDINELTDGFGIKAETANPNNLYSVHLYWGDIQDYDSNGEPVTYEIHEDTNTFEPQVEFAIGDNLAENFVIYLDTDSVLKTDSNGKEYYDINAIAYSCQTELLFSPWSANGEMTVSGVYYTE